ncbi:hypothetical protein BaRGS_00039412, partial [Batillaria attramentaria]
ACPPAVPQNTAGDSLWFLSLCPSKDEPALFGLCECCPPAWVSLNKSVSYRETRGQEGHGPTAANRDPLCDDADCE